MSNRQALRVLAGALTVSILIVLAVQLAPAAGRLAVSGLVRAATRGVSGSVTYSEANPGKEQGAATLGVVGRGTFSGKVRGPASVVATKVVAVIKGLPIDTLLKGGNYVTRYDIDARGTYHGIVVGSFKAPGAGTLCISYVSNHGKFRSGVDHFIPTTVSFTVVGGTGQAGRIRGSGTVKQTDVTGSDVERLFGTGSTQALGEGSPRPPTAACKAVAKLART